jgi:hypothetical protein
VTHDEMGPAVSGCHVKAESVEAVFPHDVELTASAEVLDPQRDRDAPFGVRHGHPGEVDCFGSVTSFVADASTLRGGRYTGGQEPGDREGSCDCAGHDRSA